MGALFLLPLGRPLGFVGSGAGCRPEAQELVSIHANNSRSPAKAVFQRTDVRDWQHLERMVLVASKEFRGADIICPGAGVYLDLPGYAINQDMQYPITPGPHQNTYRVLNNIYKSRTIRES